MAKTPLCPTCDEAMSTSLRCVKCDAWIATMKRNKKKPFRVVLLSCGNPDYGQTEPQSPAMIVPVKDLLEAKNVVQAYLAEWNLGSGNWPALAGCVYPHDSAICIAQISYNGRVWTTDLPPIEVPQAELEYAL